MRKQLILRRFGRVREKREVFSMFALTRMCVCGRAPASAREIYSLSSRRHSDDARNADVCWLSSTGGIYQLAPAFLPSSPARKRAGNFPARWKMRRECCGSRLTCGQFARALQHRASVTGPSCARNVCGRRRSEVALVSGSQNKVNSVNKKVNPVNSVDSSGCPPATPGRTSEKFVREGREKIRALRLVGVLQEGRGASRAER